MRFLVDFCELFVLLCYAPVMAYRSWRTGKYRTDWDQRRGHLPDLPAATPDRPRVWIHAVSVGETNAVRGLVEAWRKQSPQTEFVISCTTDTGIARARELLPDLTIVRYPLDFSRFVRRALDRIKPKLIVLVELEVWFNFVTIASSRGIPVAVVNGRLSEKSLRLFSKIRPIARRMFGALSWVGAQDETYAERFRQLGVPPNRVTLTGSLKWETAQIADTLPGALDLARAMGLQTEPAAQARVSRSGSSERREGPAPATFPPPFSNHHSPIWVCGSTGPGEEKIILDAFKRMRDRNAELRQLQLVIVPRKPERFDEVAALIERAGFSCVRRSQCADGASKAYDPQAVQLIDTMGELRKAYSLADVVFVGRSLVPMGGSDMMEVAALGKAIIVGPHTENFRDAMQQLLEAHAICIVGRNALAPTGAPEAFDEADALTGAVATLASQKNRALEMAARAREVVQRNLGATQRTLDRLQTLLPPAPSLHEPQISKLRFDI